MFEITPIPALKDNYIWMITRAKNKSAIIVDPGEAKPVLEMLRKNNLHLAGILITHHHWDHTDGIAELLEHFPVAVYGPANDAVKNCTHPLTQDDQIHIPELDCEFSIIEIPGHTRGHIAFVGLNGVFCGDTLFSAGCGRLFEGTAEQMLNSLNKLKQLSNETFVYSAHEYTQNNLKFAQLIEPENHHIIAHIKSANLLREKGKPTLPSTIKQEKLINPFFRCEEPNVKKSAETHAGHPLSTPLAVFTELRKWKDAF
jgi:hydroxyacylglutathione hydrolase